MALYIVQHGKSVSKEVDPERGISDEGAKEVTLIANVAKGYHVRVTDIWHSGKKRAMQTAEILASALNIQGNMKEKSGLNPMDDAIAFSRTIPNNNTMIVGHLPFLEKLISYLVVRTDDAVIFKLQNGGMVCLDQQAPGTPWYIKWALMPNIS